MHFRHVCGPVLAACLLASPLAAKPFTEMFPQHQRMEQGPERSFLEGLDYRQGRVLLEGGFAEINVPEGFYFLGPQDTEHMMQAWGNPPSYELPLGALLPAHSTPFETAAWAVEITWEPMGYVSDEDAAEIDYEDLLASMRRETREANGWRVENGYDPIELIGWAAAPYYDQAARKLHWARELKFGDSQDHTLNYELRVLGRKGVLVMTFIADMTQLPEIDGALPEVLAMTNFTEGNRYADFDPSVDKLAAVGVAGLIAGKAATKTGFLALALAFLKKGWILIVLAIGAVAKLVTGRR